MGNPADQSPGGDQARSNQTNRTAIAMLSTFAGLLVILAAAHFLNAHWGEQSTTKLHGSIATLRPELMLSSNSFVAYAWSAMAQSEQDNNLWGGAVLYRAQAVSDYCQLGDWYNARAAAKAIIQILPNLTPPELPRPLARSVTFQNEQVYARVGVEFAVCTLKGVYATNLRFGLEITQLEKGLSELNQACSSTNVVIER